MRFVLAIVSFVLALVLMGWGVAQQTIFASPDEVAATGETTGDAPVTVIDSSALNAFDGTQTLSVSGSDAVFAAYGRTTDVLAWIGDTEYNLVTYDAESGELVSEVIPGEETEVPDPAGSDLWLAEIADENSLRLKLNAPDERVGHHRLGRRAARAIHAVHHLAARQLDAVGGARDHRRRSRAAARSRVPALGDLPRAQLAGSATQAAEAAACSRSTSPVVDRPRPRRPGTAIAPVGGGRRSARPFIAVPVVLVGALALAGCTGELFPASGPSAAPSSTAEAGGDHPARRDREPDRPHRVRRDRGRGRGRRGDGCHAARHPLRRPRAAAAHHRLHRAHQRPVAHAARSGDPDGEVEVVLPQQTETWPRTVFAIIKVEDDETIAPVALMLTQDDARARLQGQLRDHPRAVGADPRPRARQRRCARRRSGRAAC